MTEVKKIMSHEFREILPEIVKEELKRESKDQFSQIYTIPEGLDLIDKKRALKRWKKSIEYYYLHPEKFEFGFKNL